jgi:hypothetical protein
MITPGVQGAAAIHGVSSPGDVPSQLDRLLATALGYLRRMTRAAVEKLSEALAHENVLFVLGSGICYDAGVPSAEMFLAATLRAHLSATLYETLQEAVDPRPEAKLQPESIYERLLRLGASDALRVWRDLAEFRTPTLTHYWAVEHAQSSNTPILTTNFDLLFEEAGRLMGYQHVYVFNNEGERGPDPVHDGRLSIWKVHGGIGPAGDVSGMRSTLTMITTENRQLLEELQKASGVATLIIGGYSGRDMDLFPELVRIFKGSRVFWLDRQFADSHGDLHDELHGRARDLGAVPIALYPSDFLDRVDWRPQRHVPIAHGVSVPSPASTASPEWSHFHETVFAAECLLAASRNEQAWQLLAGAVEPSPPDGPIALEYWVSRARAAHETGRIAHCGQAARRGLATLRLIRRGRTMEQALARAYKILLISLRAEHRRMEFAYYPLSPARPPLLRGLLSVATILADGLHLVLLHRRHSISSPQEHLPLLLAAEFEFIEFGVRALSFVQSAWERLPGGAVKRALGRRLDQPWSRVERTSRRVGYAGGIANVAKYRTRLRRHEGGDWSEAARSADASFEFLKYSTGAELAIRARAEALLDQGDLANASMHFEEVRKRAITSGSTLNEAKALIGLLRSGCAGSALSQDASRERLREVAEGCDTKAWRSYLKRSADAIG